MCHLGNPFTNYQFEFAENSTTKGIHVENFEKNVFLFLHINFFF